MKTIFIVISQGLLVRNILRSGTLELLKKRGHKVIVLILCETLPDYIKQEFADDNVELVAVPHEAQKIRGLHRRFILLTHLLINNNTTRVYFRYSRHYINRAPIVISFYLFCLKFFSSLRFLKTLVRWLEKVLFPEKKAIIKEYFDKYKPDLVFATSITSKIDNVFLKEARRRKVTSVAMTKSWDNAAKMYYRFIPDYFIVQNETIKNEVTNLQHFPKDNIFVVGFAQFDWYVRPETFRTKEEHFKKMGLDPERKVIFFGSQGYWFPYDYRIGEYIYQWITNDELIQPCQLLLRPHFTNVKKTPLEKLRGKPHVVFDDTYHISEVFSDNWDPTVSEIIDFTNTIFYSDIIVMVYSTLALDAVCFNKPIINALFECTYQRGKDVTALMGVAEHYNWIFATRGTSVAETAEVMKKQINEYLVNNNYKSAERTILKEKMCYKVDGQSSQRIVEAINSILSKYNKYESNKK